MSRRCGWDWRKQSSGMTRYVLSTVILRLFCFPQIDGFVAIPKYILKGRYDSVSLDLMTAFFTRDPLTDPGLPALGPFKDQLPQDLNVTFFFGYNKATVETIEIINTTNGE